MLNDSKLQYYASLLEGNRNLDFIPEGFKFYYENIKMDFNNKNFEVSKDLIDRYHLKKVVPFLKQIKNGEIGNSYFYSTSFIERIKNPLDPSKFDEFKIETLERMFLYYFWNFLNKEEVVSNLLNFKFLGSTRKLISKDDIFKYLTRRFKSLDHLYEFILENFIINENWKLVSLSEFLLKGDEEKNYNYLNNFHMYDWFFGKEFQRAIRILENEVRVDNGANIIGSFYNEDILFKSILLKFGDKYRIVSQGMPNWLKPQRLDIYIPELNIGVEYQGEQHFRPVDFGGKGPEFTQHQFKENLKRDNMKRIKCLDNGCLLLEMKFDDDLDIFLKKLENEIELLQNGGVD